jgi:hypothetical protein
MLKSRMPFIGALALLLLALAAWAALSSPGTADAVALVETDPIAGPIVGEPVLPELSPPLRSLPLASDAPPQTVTVGPRRNPLEHEPDQGARGTWDRTNVPLDPLRGSLPLEGRTPSLDLTFDGTSNPVACGGCTPSDPNGDTGPGHYIQMVNATKVAIYNKAGNLISGPFNLGTLWSSGNCQSNAGDPIVMYDPLADRWLLSQFASPTHLCVAISQTPDPTGAYFLYMFNVGSFPDYFKFGVWPDAYYMSANEATYTAYAFDRTNMLAGLAATFQKFTGGTNLYLPSDLDGATPPPAGAPNVFYTFKDDAFHGGSDRLELREFHVDWAVPANTTFTLVASPAIAAFTYTPCGFFNFNCIRQLGTAQRFDAVAEWPMHRFPYRNFGAHQSQVGTFVVGGGLGEEGAAIRWFELRKTGGAWTLFQEGTLDPGDGHDRVNPSVAMDGQGNIGIGYTTSSSAIHPQIRYATRLAGDPLGTMGAEAIMIAPNGSQTGSNRWGDYAATSVDPANDCSFWHTNIYYNVNSASNWRTLIGVFTIPECVGGGDPTPTPTVTQTPTPSATGPTPTATNTSGGGRPTKTPTATATPSATGPTPTATNTSAGGRPTKTPTLTTTPRAP